MNVFDTLTIHPLHIFHLFRFIEKERNNVHACRVTDKYQKQTLSTRPSFWYTLNKFPCLSFYGQIMQLKCLRHNFLHYTLKKFPRLSFYGQIVQKNKADCLRHRSVVLHALIKIKHDNSATLITMQQTLTYTLQKVSYQVIYVALPHHAINKAILVWYAKYACIN